MSRKKRQAPLPDPGSFHAKIRGISQSDRQKWARKLRAGQELLLVREPGNRHDSDAIMVLAKFGLFRSLRQLGYLSKELAEEYADFMDSGGRLTAVVSEVTGGGGMLWSKRFYGVNLLLTVYQ